LDGVTVRPNDVLINITGDSVARVCSVPSFIKQARVNQHVAIIRADESKLNPCYLKYYLLSPSVKNKLLGMAFAGATRKALSKVMLDNFEVSIPDITSQARIADILSSLDDKIELNRQMNQTLEEMAQTLFKHHFVDGIDKDNLPEGWRMGTFEEHLDVIKGLSYKGSGLTDMHNGIPMHNLNSVYEGGGYKAEGIKYYNGEYKDKHLVSPWDIIVTNTEQGHKLLLIGYPAVIPSFMTGPGIITHHIYKLAIKDEVITPQYLYYLLLQPSIREQIISCTNGTTVNMLFADGLKIPVFAIPPKKLVFEFSSTVSNLWLQSESNHLESQTLTELRDYLLPKLISGEVVPQDLEAVQDIF